MPAFTPNRNYPYSVPADPVDIPGDIQRLAEAIDTDVHTLTENITVRPAMRLSGTDPFITTTTTGTGELLPLDNEDFNTGIEYLRATQIVGSSVRRTIRILTPGLYFILGTVAYPRPTSGTNRIDMSVRLTAGPGFPGFPPTIARSGNALQPTPSDGIRTGSASTTWRITGVSATDSNIGLEFLSRPAASSSDTFTVTERTLLFVRMDPTP
jgi:hypothetical protein